MARHETRGHSDFAGPFTRGSLFRGIAAPVLAMFVTTAALDAAEQQTAAPAAGQQSRPPASLQNAPSTPPLVMKTKTPEEKAAADKFQQERDSNEQIRQIEDFLLKYPNSEYKEQAFQTAALAYEGKADYNHAVTYGELALSENQNNVTALLVLSTAISEMTGRNDSDRDERLTEGSQYAHHALEVVDAIQRPTDIPQADWDQSKRDAQSAAHAALGLMSMLREDLVSAETELQQAVDLSGHPDGVLLYRLALSHAFLKKYDLALEALDKAAAVGGVRVATPQGAQRDLIAEARQFVMRARGGAAPPDATEQNASGSAAPAAPTLENVPAAPAGTPKPDSGRSAPAGGTTSPAP